MADVLGIASGVAGIVSLGISVCQGLLGYYDSWKDAEDSVTSMRKSIEALMKTFERLSSCIKGPGLSADCVKNVEECITSCVEGIESLQKKLNKIKLTPTDDSWKEKAKAQFRKSKYPFKESTLAKLKETGNELRDHLSLALNVLQIDTSSNSLTKLDNMKKQLDYVSAGVDTLVSTKIDDELLKICDWLSPLAGQFESKQLETFSLHGRQDGMAKRVLQTDEFKSWLSGTRNCLWCQGSPGVGKSVFASFVIDFLGRTINKADIGLAYIYCNYKESESQTPGNLLSDLLRQLLLQKPVITETLKSLYEKHKENKTRLSLPQCFNLIQNQLNSFSRIFVVIDALDECPEAEQRRDILLNHIQKLEPKLSLLVTSRPIPQVKRVLESTYRLEIQASNEDMEHFLHETIPLSSNLSRFVQKEDTLRERITSTIIDKAQGMFLLARLHLDSLATAASLRHIKKALQMLPESLEVTYDQAMERIDEQGSEVATIARKILSWIFYAFRPLTIEEVQHAIAVEPGDSDFDADGLIEEDVIVSVCAGLVTVQQESNTVGMVHYTTQEYFERKEDSLFPGAERDLALTCITYLSFDKFREVGEMYEIRSPKGPLPDPPSNDDWLPENFDQYWWNNWIPENYHLTDGHHGDGPPGGYHLLAYCGRYWADHVRGDFEVDLKEGISALLSNFKKVAPSEWWQSSDGCWTQSPYYIRHFSALQMAAFMGLVKTINNLLENGACIEKDLNGYTALHAAALGIAADHTKEVIACLLDHGADINARIEKGYQNGCTALQLTAAVTRNPDALRYLLERGANVNVEDARGRTALISASQWAEEDILQSLLDKGANVNATDMSEGSALQSAASSGSLQKVLYLLSSGADMDPNALKSAAGASTGGLEIVQCLLDRGADVEARSQYSKTALHIAADKGKLEIVQCLLDRGADVEARNNFGETALHIAADKGKLEIVQCLLDRGADIEARSEIGETALYIAVESGELEIVQCLLDRGADIEARSKYGETVLHYAAEIGKLEIVQCLLDRGADTEAKYFGKTVLCVAAEAGQSGTVQWLLDRGVDIHAVDDEGNTVLHFARRGYGRSIEVLVQAGARVDIKNRKGETPLDTALRYMVQSKKYNLWSVANSQRAFLVLLRAAPPNILDMVSYIRPIVTEEGLERLKACVQCTELLASNEEGSPVPCNTCATDFERLLEDYVAMERKKRKEEREAAVRELGSRIDDREDGDDREICGDRVSNEDEGA